jgi:hypothetical protein
LILKVNAGKEAQEYDTRRAAEDLAREIAKKQQEKTEKPRD